MDIESYVRVGSISFGMTETEVRCKLGTPQFINKNNSNEEEYHYSDMIVRFDPLSHEFRECSLVNKYIKKLTLNGLMIDCECDFFNKLCQLDGRPFEFYGIIVLLELGLTLTGFHDKDESQRAITAFRKGDWDRFKLKLKPFAL